MEVKKLFSGSYVFWFHGIRTFLWMMALTLISTGAIGQERGTVTVSADPAISSLLKKRLEINREAARGSFISAEGFRVQIFSGPERNAAYAEQTRFKARYPLIGCYISYTQPNYKIRVGDFRTRLEAEKFMNTLRPSYPSLFIIPEKINLSR
jgi:hypothetical protein